MSMLPRTHSPELNTKLKGQILAVPIDWEIEKRNASPRNALQPEIHGMHCAKEGDLWSQRKIRAGSLLEPSWLGIWACTFLFITRWSPLGIYTAAFLSKCQGDRKAATRTIWLVFFNGFLGSLFSRCSQHFRLTGSQLALASGAQESISWGIQICSQIRLGCFCL